MTKSVNLKKDTYKRIMQIAGEMQALSGEKVIPDEVIKELIRVYDESKK